MRRFAKPLYGLKPVPGVRIPPSPPVPLPLAPFPFLKDRGLLSRLGFSLELIHHLEPKPLLSPLFLRFALGHAGLSRLGSRSLVGGKIGRRLGDCYVALRQVHVTLRQVI